MAGHWPPSGPLDDVRPKAKVDTTEAFPNIVLSARANRVFLARAVRCLVREAGIRQFLDIGTGLPAANNIHGVAQHVAPECRVMYVDNDRCKPGCAHVPVAGQVD